MNLSKMLTNEELTSIPGPVLAKLESAIDSENDKQGKRFKKLLDTVGSTAEAKLEAAVSAAAERYAINADAAKAQQVLQDVASLLEGVGLPATEAYKKLLAEKVQADAKLKAAYQEREHVMEQMNEQKKKLFIYQEVQGMRPEIVDAVMNHFIKCDIREITSDAIMKFIDGHDNNIPMNDVDQDAGGELNMDKVRSALADIDHDFELDVPDLPSTKKGRFEALGNGLPPERIMMGSPDVSFEDLNAVNSGAAGMDSDEAAVFAAFDNLGFGQFG